MAKQKKYPKGFFILEPSIPEEEEAATHFRYSK